MIGYTLDTGALLALERRRLRATAFARMAREDGGALTVPANVVAEWWRRRSDLRDAILEAAVVEPMDEDLAKRVGETLAVVRGATLVDATVVVPPRARAMSC